MPLFEREWHIAMRRELGVNYFSDPTHFIEYRLDEFAAEIDGAGLRVTEQLTPWGETTAWLRPS